MKLLLLAAAAAAVAIQPAPPISRPNLSWLSGSWSTTENGRWTEEQWSAPRLGALIGFSRSGAGTKAGKFEFIRIEPDPGGTPVYWASPEGRTPVGFRLIRADRQSAAFENPAHDYPQRIAYRRDGETLVASISAIDGTHAKQWRYRRIR